MIIQYGVINIAKQKIKQKISLRNSHSRDNDVDLRFRNCTDTTYGAKSFKFFLNFNLQEPHKPNFDQTFKLNI